MPSQAETRVLEQYAVEDNAIARTGNNQDNDETSALSSASGINIHDALAILSDRSKKGSERKQMNENSEGTAISEEKKRMGQNIKLFEATQEWTTLADQECPCETGDDSAEIENSSQSKELQETQEKLANQTEQHRQQLKHKISSQAHQDLLKLISEIQRERVSTYKKFDTSLQTVLDSGGNVSQYPAAVAQGTASFAVLSNTMNVIRDILGDRAQNLDSNPISNNETKDQRTTIKNGITWIEILQRCEKQKLNLNAALHLEKIRETSEMQEQMASSSSAVLFRQGIQSLQQQLRPCIEEINEVLEEIRYAIAEAEED
jgi:hypothetical protein